MDQPDTKIGTQKPKPRWRRALSGTLLGLSSVIVIVVFALVAMLNTETGRVWLVEQAIALTSSADKLDIQASGLYSESLGQLGFSELSLNVNGERLVLLRDFVLQWHPGALLARRVSITELSAASLHYFAPEQPHQGNSPSPKTFELPALKFSLPIIKLQHLSIGSINLSLLERNNALTEFNGSGLTGSVNTNANNARVQLSLTPIDQPPIRLALAAERTSTGPSVWKLGLHAEEEAHGLTSALLQIPEHRSLNAGIQVELTTPARRWTASVHSSTLIGIHTLDIDGPLVIDTREDLLVATDGLRLALDDARNALRGELRGDSLDVQLTLHQFPLTMAQLWIPKLSDGHLSAELNIKGPVNGPAITGTVKSEGRYHDQNFRADINVAGDATRMEIDRAVLRYGEAEGRVKGGVSLENRTLDLQYDMENIRVALVRNFSDAIPEKLQGQLISAKGFVAGEWTKPKVSSELRADLNYNDTPVKLSGTLGLSANQVIQIEEFVLKPDQGQLRISGSVAINESRLNLFAQARALPFWLAQIAGVSLPPQLEGRLTGSAKITGPWNNPAINTDLLAEGRFEKIPLRLVADAAIKERTARIERFLISSNGDTWLEAGGTIDASALDLNVSTKTLPSELLQLAGLNLSPGEFSADLSLNGTPEQPRINGDFAYRVTVTARDEQDKRIQIPITFALNIHSAPPSDGQSDSNTDDVVMRLEVKKGDEQTGSLEARIGLSWIDQLIASDTSTKQVIPLDASIKGTLDLTAISSLGISELHRTEGTANFNLGIAGDLGAPELEGYIELNEGAYDNTLTGTVIAQLECRIEANNTEFTIDACNATDGDRGRYAVTGELTLPYQDSGNIDITVHTQAAQVVDQYEFQGELSGDITIRGDMERVAVAGNLDVTPLTVNLDASFDSGIPTIKVKEVYTLKDEEKKPEGTGVLPEIRLDIEVNAERQAYLRGRGLEVEIAGKVDLEGNLNRIGISGEFQTLRGDLELFNKSFTIQQGQIRFVDSRYSMLIEARYSRQGQEITAIASGTNALFDLALSANPSMAEDEILAFILFGKSVQNMSPFEAVQLASAVQKLQGGKSLFDPVGTARKVLDVDTLSIESAETESGESGLSLGIGKYLSDNVYLELERTPDPSSPWRGRLEIELLPNLILESATGGKSGVEGAQFKWKRDYR